MLLWQRIHLPWFITSMLREEPEHMARNGRVVLDALSNLKRMESLELWKVQEMRDSGWMLCERHLCASAEVEAMRKMLRKEQMMKENRVVTQKKNLEEDSRELSFDV
jgi:hypothetical protein